MRKLLFLLIVCTPAGVAAQTKLPPAATSAVDYEQNIKPLLLQNCYGCHGPDVQQSGLRLDLRQNALRGGDYGPVILPGHSDQSKLIKRLVDGDGGLQMPPTGALTDQEIGILRAWIDQGAEFRTEIAEEAPAKPIDPKLAAFIEAIRTADAAAVEALAAANPALVTAADPAGDTPLHHAAGFGTLKTLTWLLDHGADVNAKNRRLSTPLFWAIHDEAKVRLLLSRGAAVNAKQIEGRTPVYQAAGLGGKLSVLRVLLENGGDPKTPTLVGQTPLMLAAARADTAAMQLLIDKGADVNVRNGAGETALMSAGTNGSADAVRLLLEKGADATVKSKRTETALGNASTAGVADSVKLLLDHGADVNVRNIRGYSPVMLAASSDAIPAAAVKMLLAKGADTSFTADYDESARILAAKRGNTEVARLLGPPVPAAVPVRVAMAARDGIPAGGASGAVEKAMGLLEKASYSFIRTAGCNSCHSQDLPSAAAGYARDTRLAVPKEFSQLPASMLPSADRQMDLAFVNVTSSGWELFDLGMNHQPRTASTDATVRYIKAMQTPQGNWPSNEGRRPPMNSGDFQTAALAVYALKQYAPPLEKTDTDAVLASAVRWLESAKPTSTQDRAFHLLALKWANASPAAIKDAARALSAMQRTDGGWSQMPTMVSDAYATGEVLYALNAAGKMSVASPVYRRGVDYLLRSQAADGSWHVETRSIWLQPYFESGFPYGRDQFISAAGTAWACMALTAVVDEQAQPKKVSSR